MHYLKFFRMPPSFTCIIKVNLIQEQTLAIQNLDQLLSKEPTKMIEHLQPHEINYILFSCENEEKDHTQGKRGTYGVPSYGNLPYAGFAGYKNFLKFAKFD